MVREIRLPAGTAYRPAHIVSISLLLLVVSFSVYRGVRNHEFLKYDDDEYVTDNEFVREGLTRESIVWAVTSTHAGNWHPLTWLSHMLDCELFGLSPASHHFTNVAIHAVNAILFFLLLDSMTGAPWRSAFAAALFAVHPLHVESVAWVAERKDVLSAFFWFLTMISYLYYTRNPKPATYLPVVLAFSLGLTAKPMIVTLPLVLLLLDYWPLRRLTSGDGGTARGSKVLSARLHGRTVRVRSGPVVEKLPLLLLSVLSSVVTVIAQKKGGAVGSFDAYPLPSRIMNALVSYAAYLGKTFLPVKLAVFYPYRRGGFLAVRAFAAAILLAAVTYLVIGRLRNRPYLAVGWLWYVTTLVPVIGIVQVGSQAMADRYTYIPSAGIFVMVSWGAWELLKRRRHRTLLSAAGAGAVLTACSAATVRQTEYWHDTGALFRHAIEVTRDNYLAHNNYGMHLFEKGDLDGAREHFEEALRIKPDYAEARNNLGNVLARENRYEAAAAHYRETLRTRPELAGTHYNLANVLVSLGSYDEAARHYREAIRLRPGMKKAYGGLGDVLMETGNAAGAEECYRKALELDPGDPDFLCKLGRVLAARGDYEAAAEYLTEAVKSKPDHAEAHFHLGNVCVRLNEKEEAARHFREALNIRPDFAEAHNNLAGVLLLMKDIDGAIEHYREALRLKPDYEEAGKNFDRILDIRKEPR